MYDIAIIGAGPAGATLARLVGSSYRVLLVDRRRLDLPAEDRRTTKVCGGLLAPAAQHELARQGLGVPGTVLDGPALFAVRTVDAPASLERLYQRHYINIDRERFDGWLVSLLPGKVEQRYGWSLVSLERSVDGALLTCRTQEGTQVSATARLVVGADGASSLVRRLAFGDAEQPARYVALQSEHEAHRCEPHYGAIFDARLTDFYGWTVPKEGRLLAGIALPGGAAAPGHHAALHARFIDTLRAAGFSLNQEISRASAPISRPTSLSQLCPGGQGVLLVGEAAGFISPSSAEGISYALRSSTALASALGTGISGAEARYRVAVAPLALKVALKGAKGAAIYGQGARRAIMRSGVRSVRNVEPLVRVAPGV